MKDAAGFTAFVPGFDFIKNLSQQAGASANPSGAAMPGMAAWVAPTFDVEELDKRISELRSVQFWLDQNARALAATIQALEVQKMTLSTLKNMDVGMEDMSKAMQVNPADFWAAWQTGGTSPAGKAAPAQAPEVDKPPQPSQAHQGTGTVEPTQWWHAVSQQFQDIAANALKDIAAATAQANATAERAPTSSSVTKAAKTASPAKQAPTTASKAAAKSASGKKAARPTTQATKRRA
jgi:hypothetical protein